MAAGSRHARGHWPLQPLIVLALLSLAGCTRSSAGGDPSIEAPSPEDLVSGEETPERDAAEVGRGVDDAIADDQDQGEQADVNETEDAAADVNVEDFLRAQLSLDLQVSDGEAALSDLRTTCISGSPEGIAIAVDASASEPVEATLECRFLATRVRWCLREVEPRGEWTCARPDATAAITTSSGFDVSARVSEIVEF